MTRIPCVLALDVGGTFMKGAVVDRAGVIRHDMRAPTPQRATVARALDEIAAHVNAMLGAALDLDIEVCGVCIAVPGMVDENHGIVTYSASLGWRGVPVARELSTRLDRQVSIAHDVRAGGLAESRLGASVGARDVMFVAVGTGISAALMVDGSPVQAAGMAGEIGHVKVPGHDEPCVCGHHGCLETASSASAIARTYTHLSGICVAGAAEVAERMAAGDPIASAVWARATDALGDVLASCATVLGSRLVVVGGGLSLAGPLLIEPLTRRIATSMGPLDPPRVVSADLGDAAGCIGAAIQAWHSVDETGAVA